MQQVLFTTPALLVALAAAAPAIQERATNKKGLAYNNADQVAPLAGASSWGYDWSPSPKPIPHSQLELVPMCHAAGCSAVHSSSSSHVLMYNEPDETAANGGSNMSPAAAWAAWQRDAAPLRSARHQLVCPAVTSWDTPAGHTGGPAGFAWLAGFVGAAGGPAGLGCAAQALHWYGVAGQTGAAQGALFTAYVRAAHARVDALFGTADFPLWFTEISPLPVRDAQVMSDFLAVVVPFLDGLDYVARYSPFMAEYMVGNAAGATFAGKH
ncbi:hypothetical protein P8C59_005819 [Phyllachora maydis]|uniref:Asl1-like glycosyl hydrolase catalytic domain-containing protein n=1 Tax=Phyllachora maydis TaxID=1825666 RepID=A0AAD9I6E1_9PEZI|nr:hypothetical protein P8C59_005819 [Phyllachora maydis]